MSSMVVRSLSTVGVVLLLAAGCTTPTSVASSTPKASASAGVPATHLTPAVSSGAAASSASAAPSPSTSAGGEQPLAGRTIVIDPGHNGGWTAKFGYRKVPDGNGHLKACNSSGTATNGGYAEHAYNWAQANALAGVLRARGATVRLTRSSDTGKGPCVNKRASLANTLRADLLISIHADGNLGKGHRGFHVIMSPVMHGGKAVYARSRALAGDVRASLQRGAGMPRSNYIGKGTAFSVRSDLGTLNFAQVPAVMMEMGNMRNASDAKLFGSASWREKAATALADGIATFLG